MYRMVIVDDDIEYCIKLRSIASDFFDSRSADASVTPYTRPRDLLWDLEDNRLYNIYCVDIEMPDMSGLELAGRIRLKDEDGFIIFVSSHEKYSLEGYHYNAWRYIMKGSENEKLPMALETAIYAIERIRADKKYYVIEKYNTPTRVCLDDIYYLQVEKKYTVFYTAGGIYRERGPLKEILARLSDRGFYLLDKSRAVNLRNVAELKDADVILINDQHLPVSASHKAEIKKALADYWRARR